MTAAIALDERIIASRVVEGSFTADTFLEYLRDDLVRFLSLFNKRSNRILTVTIDKSISGTKERNNNRQCTHTSF